MRHRYLFLAVAVVAALVVGHGGPAVAQTPVIVKLDPVTKYIAYLPGISYDETNVDTDLALGDTGANEQRSQGFKVPASDTAGCVRLWLKESGTPLDNLTLEIQTDSGGLPSGTPVTDGTSDTVSGGPFVRSDYGWVAFRFSPAPSLTAGTQYHLVLSRASDPDAAIHYVWGADQSSPGYADGSAAVFNGATWTSASPDTDHAFDILALPCPGVDISVEGLETGLGAYDVRVTYDPNIVKPQSMVDGPFLSSTGRNPSCFTPVLSDADGDTTLDTIRLWCLTLGDTPAGATGAGVLATVYFVPVASAGSTILDLPPYCTQPHQQPCTLISDIAAVPIFISATEDGSAVVQALGTGDSDGDGCHDREEAGDDILLGGDRNWLDPYDYYDVPVPANADPTPNGTRNKVINLGDVLAVLLYVGAADDGPVNGNGVDYDSDKDADTIEDGRDYDRTPAPPLSGPPDGVINIGDVLATLGQVGHDCSGEPN